MDRVRRDQRRRRNWRELAARHREPQQHTAPVRDKIDCGRALRRVERTLGEGEQVVLRRVFLGEERLTDVARTEGWSHSTARRRRATLLRELRASIQVPLDPRFASVRQKKEQAPA